jgi:hypothetical protein
VNISCDVFAAELLLPYRLFKAAAEKEEISLETIDASAESLSASVTATGSRFASVVRTLCAFVLSEGGKVRYASRSTSLHQGNAFIPTRIELPPKSASAIARARATHLESDEIDPEDWFSDWEPGGTLAEEARHRGQWDQTLTLLWLEDDEVPQPVKYRDSQQGEDEELLKELDEKLSWKSKRRRR